MARSALLLALWSFAAFAAEPLPALDAELPLTVSGVSSGAYMAVQFHVSHSARVRGGAMLAGGPYYCARGSAWRAYQHCTTPSVFAPLPELASLRAEAQRQAAAGRIDATPNLAAARVWLFTGANDDTVESEVVEALRAFYRAYEADTLLVRHERAGHGMVTEGAGNACAASAPPFINDCGYDAAAMLLAHLLGGLRPPAARIEGELLRFDQRPFTSEIASMDEEGFLFVPRACQRERCRVHIVFHGCRQGKSFVGERFVRDAGYHRWAETNRLVVLYPQARASYWGSYNPRGCWDWWGYTGPRYHTKEGAQIRAVKAMADRLSAPRR